ncbi:MAG: glycosyltransferase family 4 protein [Candidatus Cloacimonetes bacterium]|nr:glycosyltransferase family 4 protein [Candidatus Cloacimonadota bacterium]
MKKKILIISIEFPPDLGGAGSVAHDTAIILANLNYNVTIITRKNKNRKLNNEKFKMITVSPTPKFFIITLMIRILILNANKYDKIILNDIGAALLATFSFSKKLQKKCLVYLHGSEAKHIFCQPKKLYQIINFKKKYKNLLFNCDKIIAVSNYMKNMFINETNLTEIAKKINIIRNGVNTTIFYYDPIDLHKKYNIPHNRKIILTVGRIIKEKGFDELIILFNKILTKNSNFHWIIVGDGLFLKKLKREITNYNIENYVTFTGFKPKSELRKIYSSSDVFVLLSRRKEESFGLVYLEANACGCPVIGKNYAGVPEVIVNYKNGFLINNNNEVYDIIINNKYDIFSRESLINFAHENSVENTMKKIEVFL